MRNYFLMLLFISTLLFEQSIAQTKVTDKFRVVGYVRESSVENGDALKIDLSKITHLNIAFINPDSNGRFERIKNIKQLVSKAHQFHVKVLGSIGGGSAPAYYSSLLMSEKSKFLIKNLLEYAEDNNLDGLDIDLEGDRIDNNYEAFVTGLSIALKSKGKLLTAAVATVYYARYTDKALAGMDFINIMSYDKTGPWKPANPGQHAPYGMAVEDLDYWVGTRGLARSRVNLGLPFYGYGFGKNAPEDMSYKDLIMEFPASKNLDSVTVAGGGTIFYNGSAIIKRKTNLALQRTGGVMVWQLFQDATGDNSLLTLINKTINSYHH